MKYILLKENIQKARKILKSIDKDESDKHFIRIKEIVGEHTGFLGLFTFLFFKKRSSLIQLSDLLENILQNRQLLKSLPKQVTNYENIEELEDDLSNVREWAIYNREFVSRLTSKLRKEAKQDMELKNSYVHLEDKNKKDLIENFITKVSRYRDYDSFKTDCIYFMNKNSQVIEDVIEKINNTKGVYLIYNELNVLIAEVFSREASCLLGSKSWCISGNGGSYWEQYAGLSTKNKQYFIWNFNVSPISLESQVGVTINENGGQKAAHLKDDSSTQISGYLKKYDIPNILTPLDVKKDISKIIDSVGITKEVMGLLNDNNLINDYIDKIPPHYKYVYGLLSDEDSENLISFKKYIYSKNRYEEEVGALFQFCEEFDAGNKEIEEFIEEHKETESMKEINLLDFKDKILLLNKYKNLGLEDDGPFVFFHNEISEMSGIYDMDIQLGSYTWDNDYDFEFEMDKDDYIEKILDSDNDEYWGLENLGSSYGILDSIDNDEFNYLYNYFTVEGNNKVIEYYKFIKNYVSHPDLLRKLDGMIEDSGLEKNYEKYGDEFMKVFEFISENIDEYFDEPYRNSSYFWDFWDKIVDSAQDLVNEDAVEYENSSKGKFEDGGRGGDPSVWKIDLDDIVDSLRNTEEAFKENVTFSVLDWINSHPSSVRNMSTHYDDSPYSSTYLNLADTELANESLIEQLDDVMNDYHSKFELENLENMKRYTDYLNKHFTPINKIHKSGWRKKDWYGYTKTIGTYLTIIPYTEITSDGYMNVYSVEKSILAKEEDELSYNYFNKENEESLKEKGISFKKVSIESLIEDEESIDPNQFKFKFEKVKTFTSFTQTK